MSWTPLVARGVASWQFAPAGEFQIALEAGDTVAITESSSGWFKGTNENSGEKGIFPANYIEILPEGADTLPAEEGAAGEDAEPLDGVEGGVDGDKDDHLLTEIDTTLTTCTRLITNYTSDGDVENYSRYKARVSTLMDWRRRFVDENTPPSVKAILRTNIVKLIEATRQLVEGFMVPRTQTGEMANSNNTGIMQLYQMHRDMQVRMEEGTNLPQSISAQEQMEINRGIRRGKGVINYALGDKTASEADAKRVVKKKKILQLLMEQQMVACGAKEPVEIYYGLWSNKTKSYITEEYVVKLTANGFPEDVRLHEKIKTVFQDLSLKEIESDIFLAIRLFRTGALQYVANKDKKAAKGEAVGYRRPWGVCALPISASLDSLADQKSFETRATIYTIKDEDETQFADLLQNIVENNGKYVMVPASMPIALKLTLLHGEMTELRLDERFTKPLLDASISQKLALPELMNASDVRNDFYLTLISGSVLGDRKTSEKNVFVRITVLSDTGSHVSCMSRGTGVMSSVVSEYKSSVIYHSNTPTWNEVLHLKLETGKMGRAHLLIILYHASSTASKTLPFAFGFLPLTSESGVCIPDKLHTISTYTPLKEMFGESITMLPTYLTDVSKLQSRVGETLTLSTLLVSTNRTTTVDLHDLLRWRELDTVRLQRVLTSVTYMADAELGKFMRAILDSLMGVFSSNFDQEMKNQCFISFLHVITKVTDKYSIYKDVLDSYLATVFKDRTVYHVLIKCLQHHLNWVTSATAKPSDTERNTLTNAIKVFPTILDFIIKSWTFDQDDSTPRSPKTVTKTKDQFKDDLADVMFRVNTLMAATEPAWLSIIQTLVLKHFAPIFEQFTTIFDASEMGDMVRGFLESIVQGGEEEVQIQKGRNIGQIKQAATAKLFLVRDLVRGTVFKIPSSRRIVMAAVVRMVQNHLNKSEVETIVCISIIKELVRTIQSMKSEDDVWNMSVLLPNITAAVCSYQKDDSAQSKNRKGSCWLNIKKGPLSYEEEPGKVLGEQQIVENDVDEIPDSVTALVTIIILLNEAQIDYYMTAILPEVEQQREFILNLVKLYRSLLKISLYPEIWLIMTMLQIEALVKVLDWFSIILCNNFNPEINDVSRQLLGTEQCVYSQFFSLALETFSERTLQIELATDKRRDFMNEQYGDKRQAIISIVNRVWGVLGRRRVSLAKVIVEPIMKITASPVPDVAVFARDILLDILKDEYTENGNFKQMEIFMIDFVAESVKTNIHLAAADDPVMQLFTVHLPPKFKTDSILNCTAGVTFLEEIALLFNLLRALEKYPVTLDFEDERTSATLTLLSYLLRTQRYDMYINQVIQFSLNHKKLNNLVEAANSLLLYGALLDWSDKPLDSLPKFGYKAQTSAQRKEFLYREAMKLFNQAQDWENCVKLLRELKDQYQNVSFDYKTVSTLLKEEAEYYDKITKTDRLFPTYFLLSSIGQLHEKEFRNKEFIYRGNVLERVGEFTSRVKHKFGSDVQMLKAGKEPADEDKNNTTEKFLRIITIGCSFAEEYKQLSIPAIARAPGRISSYVKANNVKVFTYQRPFRKRDKKSSNEFLDLWVIKAYLVTGETFPATHRRMEIIERIELTFNPLENAAVAMEDKNQDLKEQIYAVNELPDREAPQAFTMTINGTVDAVVAGGVKNYIVFFNGEYATTHPEIVQDMKDYPEKATALERLRAALGMQVSILEYGIEVHGRKCAEAMLPLHAHLQGRFVEMMAMHKTMGVVRIPVKKWF